MCPSQVILFATEKIVLRFPCVTVPGWLVGSTESIVECDHTSCWRSSRIQTFLEVEVLIRQDTPLVTYDRGEPDQPFEADY